MKLFISKRTLFLNELLRREGRGEAVHDHCLDCADPSRLTANKAAVIRCMTGSPGPMSCEDCAVRKHAVTPYHRVKVRRAAEDAHRVQC